MVNLCVSFESKYCQTFVFNAFKRYYCLFVIIPYTVFVEPHFNHKNTANNKGTGWIEVICGSMFSGKTEELIRRLKRAKIAQQHVEIFKPIIDTRYHATDVVSHDENIIRSTPVHLAEEIGLLAGSCEVVGIDEVQFFDDGIVDVCNRLATAGKRVIVAGLDMDYAGKPFGAMPQLMAIAEFVTKVHAICMQCGSIANYSYRLSEDEKQFLLGEKQSYEPRCRSCFEQGMKAKKTQNNSNKK
jgi:thymidine kinase